jgi:hypothetical protein
MDSSDASHPSQRNEARIWTVLEYVSLGHRGHPGVIYNSGDPHSSIAHVTKEKCIFQSGREMTEDLYSPSCFSCNLLLCAHLPKMLCHECLLAILSAFLGMQICYFESRTLKDVKVLHLRPLREVT